MNPVDVIGVSVVIVTALLIVIIGVIQLGSDTAMDSYIETVNPSKKELEVWNRKHGVMWTMYGLIIITGAVMTARIINTIYAAVPLTTALLVPLPIMTSYHYRLVRRSQRRYAKENYGGGARDTGII